MLFGLEAASRGCQKTILCDNSKKAIEIIQKNIEKTHLKNKVELYNLDYITLLKKLKEKIDIIYIDPPYNSDFAIKSIEIILQKNIVDEKSLIIIETDIENMILEKLQQMPVNLIEIRKYGRINLIFLKTRKG